MENPHLFAGDLVIAFNDLSGNLYLRQHFHVHVSHRIGNILRAVQAFAFAFGWEYRAPFSNLPFRSVIAGYNLAIFEFEGFPILFFSHS